MQTRLVDTITSNEEHVRMRIFDGAIPVDEADREMRRVEICQLKAENRRLRTRNAELSEDLQTALQAIEAQKKASAS